MKLSLYDMAGTGVIIKLRTGVFYSNQTGGTACLQPEEEGVFFPLNNDFLEGHPESFPVVLGKVFKDVGRFDSNQADQIDLILGKFSCSRGVSVIRERIGDSHEAWVYVAIRMTQAGGISEFQDELLGVLTWVNSD